MNLGFHHSGTTYVCNQLGKLFNGRVHVLHEDINARTARLRQYFRCYEPERIDAALAEPSIGQWLERIRELAEGSPVVITGATTNHLAPVFLRMFGDRLRTIHVYRHPVNIAAVMYIGTWHTNWNETRSINADPTGWVLTPDDPHVRFRGVSPRWPTMGPVARIAYNWLERTGAALEFVQLHPDVRHVSLRAETEIFNSDVFVREIAKLLQVDLPTGDLMVPTSHNASWSRSIEERPLGKAWKQIYDVPEMLELATSLGYGFEPKDIETRTRKYQLPAGVGPWLRHRARYWQTRRRLAAWLRKKSLIPQSRPVHGGGPPRTLAGAMSDLLPQSLRQRLIKDDE